jgi:L-threonylcarbamoyladenylate synthase
MVAARLYSTLRELDAAGADVIYVRGFSDHGLWAAVQDRLRRAAAGRIIQT